MRHKHIGNPLHMIFSRHNLDGTALTTVKVLSKGLVTISGFRSSKHKFRLCNSLGFQLGHTYCTCQQHNSGKEPDNYGKVLHTEGNLGPFAFGRYVLFAVTHTWFVVY